MRPLLTFAIFAYEQEEFIRDAIDGALAQTYSPLEIVLSDDCSSDGTFAAMDSFAAAYKGPHKIILNRNPRNLGLVGHFNRVADLSHGKYLVAAAGDDISLPQRVEVTWDALSACSSPAAGFHGRVINIDKEGKIFEGWADKNPSESPVFRRHGPESLSEFLNLGSPVVMGCTAAWNSELFEQFGPIPEDVPYEDMPLTFRALLTKGLVFSSRPIVKYRLHSSNIHNTRFNAIQTRQELKAEEEARCRDLKRRVAVARSFTRDLSVAREQRMHPEKVLKDWQGGVERFAERNAMELRFRTSGMLRRWLLYSSVRHLYSLSGLMDKKLCYALFPREVYYLLRKLKAGRLARRSIA